MSAPPPLDPARLQRSWATVAQFGDQVPLFFYSALFVCHPELRDLFPLAMAAQRDRLVSALGRVVSGADDLAALAPVLEHLGRDHRRFSVTRDHYPLVGEALLATLEHFLADEWSDELAADWAAAYELVSGVMVGAAEAAAGTPPWFEATVTGVDRRTTGVVVLRVTPDQPIPYRAGQSLAMEVAFRPRSWRYYTPATLPDDTGSFELHIRAVSGGGVSTAIVQRTRPDDAVRFATPVGEALTLDDSVEGDLVMIAGGTGLAPMKALIQQVAAEGGRRRVHLFWGGRRPHDLYDLPALEQLAAVDWLHVVPCVSRPLPPGTRLQQGDAVEVALRRCDLAAHHVYVCGSPEMVGGTLDALVGAGVPADRIHHEQFGNDERQAG